MLKKSYETERMVLLQSDAALAARVLAFYNRNKDFLQETEPKREKIFFTEPFQRRALARDYSAARNLTGLRLWLVPRDEPDTGDIIGMVALNNIVFGPFQSAFVAYKLDGGQTHKGFMTEALKKLIEVAFEDLGLHRLEANIMPRNLPSLKLVERLGFENEGIARKYLQINGVWEDHIHTVLLNER